MTRFGKAALITSLLFIPVLAIPNIASAESGAKLEGVFTDWTVYSRSDGGEKICYALAKPTTKTPSTFTTSKPPSSIFWESTTPP